MFCFFRRDLASPSLTNPIWEDHTSGTRYTAFELVGAGLAAGAFMVTRDEESAAEQVRAL